ncbi:RELT-like protein 2 [Hyperolius riggenbachi]|uniref:RELT-like protein 2 n=1 Tax=Hyperolius riggenbachi TaxID=752182 RepID=UPI0035A3978E
MAENQTDEKEGNQQSPYMLFLLVVVFFVMGLVGILICHILKKKGYRCRTSPEEDEELKEELSAEKEYSTDEISNDDTVDRIVKCIIQNEANAEALKQMLGDTEGEVPVVPSSICPHRESQDAGPTHHHTVHGGSQAPCIHCTRKKRNLLHRMGRSKDSRGKSHPGEVTVFSVGRFRVTHIGKKSSMQLSQEEHNIGSDPASSDKDVEDQQAAKSKNGIPSHRVSLGFSQNGPDAVGLAQLDSQIETKLADKNGLKSSEDQKMPQGKASKERRSSAPEHTALQREQLGILPFTRTEQIKELSESEDKQGNRDTSSSREQ